MIFIKKSFFKLKISAVLSLVLLSVFIFSAGITLAQGASGGTTKDTVTGGGTACPTGAKCLEDPLGNNGNFAVVANKLIKGTLGVVGILAIIAFIWGGIEWMISGGSPDRIKKGKSMMIWAVWGLVVIFGSYAILNLIFTALGAT